MASLIPIGYDGAISRGNIRKYRMYSVLDYRVVARIKVAEGRRKGWACLLLSEFYRLSYLV
jgi:hypothetical protein